MIDVLELSDKQVRAKLFDRALKAPRAVLVAQVRHGPQMRAVSGREPFISLERALGHILDQVLVADEGKVEGMWRDPVGDLAETLFPDDRPQAYLATANYLVLHQGLPLGVVKRQAAAEEDVWWVQDLLAKSGLGVAAPGPTPRTKRPSPPPPARPPPAKPAMDPWALLAIPRGTRRAEARKLFHALIAQYHPDKVAHLAPEFRVLAEEKTRVILAAWQEVEPRCP